MEAMVSEDPNPYRSFLLSFWVLSISGFDGHMFGGWVVVRSVRVDVVGGLRHGPGQVLDLDVRAILAYQ